MQHGINIYACTQACWLVEITKPSHHDQIVYPNVMENEFVSWLHYIVFSL